MRKVLDIVLRAFDRLSKVGKKTLAVYTASLIVITGFDALALIILARFFQESESLTSAAPVSAYLPVGIVTILFLARSLLSTGVSYLAISRFAEQEVLIGNENYANIEKLPWAHRKNLRQSDYFSLIDRGPNILVQGLMLSSATVVAESVAALVIIGVLFVTQPVTALISLVYFVIVILLQHRILSVASTNAGSMMYKATASTYDYMGDGAKFSKILQVMPSMSFSDCLAKERSSLATARAKVNFLSTLPRYFMETILAVGFIFIAGFVFILQGPDKVLPAISLFAAAGFRLLPIFNRIQGGVLSCFSYEPLVQESMDLEDKVNLWIEQSKKQTIESDNSDLKESMSKPDSVCNPKFVMQMVNVSYRHEDSKDFSVLNANLDFEFGKQYALVGPSGSGKTTLVDMCVGLLAPNTGEVLWNQDIRPSVAYVQQETSISIGSVFQNIALEWSDERVSTERSSAAIKSVKLEAYFDDNGKRYASNSIDFENLTGSLSGGQKQRLGLARAFYRDANFIVLDEATSALDSTLEREIMQVVEGLRGKATVILIAHRLSTIQNADEIIYLEQGRVIGKGNFAELMLSVPAFREQVESGEITSR